jgi:hypothetical protein
VRVPFAPLPLISLLAVLGGWALVVGGAAFYTGPDGATWRARSETLDRPQLWSIEALGAPDGWRPVRICTDSRLRSGFVSPAAAVGDRPCVPVEDAATTGARTAYRCVVNGQLLGASAVHQGDLARAFTTTVTFVHLGRQISGGGEAVLQQTLRYSRLGDCPAAWPVGAHTDRRGRMQPDARWVREARARWP